MAHVRFRPAALALAVVVTACTGCGSTLNPAPFRQFDVAVREARSGLDDALDVGATWEREARILELGADTTATFSPLILEFGAGYSWSLADTSIYMVIQQSADTLSALTGALAGYAALLADVAAAELTSPEEFELLSGDLNQGVAEFARAAGRGYDAAGLALISTSAGELFRRYVDSRQRDLLRGAIEENQASVDGIAGRCITLVQLLRDRVRKAYVERYEPIRARWTAARAGKRAKPVEEMLDLNDACVRTLRMLQELEQAYRTLPAAHAALSATVSDPGADVEAIQRLFESSQRLQRLYAKLRARASALEE